MDQMASPPPPARQKKEKEKGVEHEVTSSTPNRWELYLPIKRKALKSSIVFSRKEKKKKKKIILSFHIKSKIASISLKW